MKAILTDEIQRHKFPQITDKDDNVRRFQSAWNSALDSLSKSAETIELQEQQPHSHWVKFGGTGSEFSDRWQCARCKQTARAESWGKVCEYERCPHCGAIMDGGTENA